MIHFCELLYVNIEFQVNMDTTLILTMKLCNRYCFEVY